MFAHATPASVCGRGFTSVTVRNVAGDFLFGPEILPASTAIAAVREQINPAREGKPCRVQLLRGTQQVADAVSVDQLSENNVLELTAIYSELLLSPVERQRCLAQLAGPAANPATVALYTFAQFSPEARADKEVAMEAVRRHTLSLEHAHRSLKADRELLLEAVGRDGYSLAYAHASLRADRELVLEAVQNNGYALQFAHPSLQNDREVVRRAVKTHGCALQFASAALRSDREIATEAVLNHATAANFSGVAVEDPALEVGDVAFTPCSSTMLISNDTEMFRNGAGVSAVMARVHGIERELGHMGSLAAPLKITVGSAELAPAAVTKAPIRFASSPLPQNTRVDPVVVLYSHSDGAPGRAANAAMPVTPRNTSRGTGNSVVAPPVCCAQPAHARNASMFSPCHAALRAQPPVRNAPVLCLSPRSPRSGPCSSPAARGTTAVVSHCDVPMLAKNQCGPVTTRPEVRVRQFTPTSRIVVHAGR